MTHRSDYHDHGQARVREPDLRPFRRDWRAGSLGADLYVGGQNVRTEEELAEYDAMRRATKEARREAWRRRVDQGGRRR